MFGDVLKSRTVENFLLSLSCGWHVWGSILKTFTPIELVSKSLFNLKFSDAEEYLDWRTKQQTKMSKNRLERPDKHRKYSPVLCRSASSCTLRSDWLRSCAAPTNWCTRTAGCGGLPARDCNARAGRCPPLGLGHPASMPC